MKLFIDLKHLREQFFVVHKSQCEDCLNDKMRPATLFVLTILFYLFYQLLMQPGWVTGGEMWAEMATNYYPNANASSYFQKLLSTDAGYIPLPQRLIALIGNQLNLPAASIPYFYTWSSILFTVMLVGSFCLAQFRKVVKSDLLRFCTSIAILLVADFETRTFINFSYFSAFFAAIVTALALVDDTDDVPWWAGFVPIFMVSKPAVLAALPAMILAAFVSRSRFRWIVFFAVLLCMGQFVQMFVSAATGAMPVRSADFTFSSKLIAIGIYFLGLLGGYITGPIFHLEQLYLMLAGALLLGLCACLVAFKRSSANALILVGMSLLFFNVFLNVFAMSDWWNFDLAWLHDIPIYRHIIVGFFGCVLVVSGVIASVTMNDSFGSLSRFMEGAGTCIFAIWFIGVGWLTVAGNLSREPIPPTVNSSQWQIMADAIDTGVSPLCVPINPWWKGANWMYHRNCGLLKSPPAWEDGRLLINEKLTHKITLPDDLMEKTLVSAAVLVKPLGPAISFVDVVMRIELKDGSATYFSGSRELSSRGGLLMLVGENPIAISEVSGAFLTFNVPVEVARAAQESAGVPGVAWMGY